MACINAKSMRFRVYTIDLIINKNGQYFPGKENHNWYDRKFYEDTGKEFSIESPNDVMKITSTNVGIIMYKKIFGFDRYTGSGVVWEPYKEYMEGHIDSAFFIKRIL